MIPNLRYRDSGLGVVMVEMPGSYAYKQPMSTASEAIYHQVIEHVAAHPRVDASRMGFVGTSFGGYWAARMAATSTKLRCAVACGAPTDHSFRASLGTPQIILQALADVTGASGPLDLSRKLHSLSLRDMYGQITIPLLVINGDTDTLLSTQDSIDLAHGARNSTLRLYPNDDHCAMGHYREWLDLSRQWMRDQLASVETPGSPRPCKRSVPAATRGCVSRAARGRRTSGWSSARGATADRHGLGPAPHARDVDAISPHTDRAPISLLINTHPDGDHWWGNAELPGAEVLASDSCVTAMREEATPEKLLALAASPSSAAGSRPRRGGGAVRGLDARAVRARGGDAAIPRPDVHRTTDRDDRRSGSRADRLRCSAHRLRQRRARPRRTRPLHRRSAVRRSHPGDLARTGRELDRRPGRDHDPRSRCVRPWARPDQHPHATAGAARLLDVADRGRDHPPKRRPRAAQIAKRLTRTPEFAAFRAWENPERLYINVATIARQLHDNGPIPTDPITRGKAFDAVACLCRYLQTNR